MKNKSYQKYMQLIITIEDQKYPDTLVPITLKLWTVRSLSTKKMGFAYCYFMIKVHHAE